MTDRDRDRKRLIHKNNLEGKEINSLISKKHPYGDEKALLRKEIWHIEQALNIQPTAEFKTYYEEAEAVKAEVKA